MDIPRTLFDDLKQSILASIEALNAGQEALQQDNREQADHQFLLARQHAETAQRTMRALEMRDEEESSWNRLRGREERLREDQHIWEEP